MVSRFNRVFISEYILLEFEFIIYKVKGELKVFWFIIGLSGEYDYFL